MESDDVEEWMAEDEDEDDDAAVVEADDDAATNGHESAPADDGRGGHDGADDEAAKLMGFLRAAAAAAANNTAVNPFVANPHLLDDGWVFPERPVAPSYYSNLLAFMTWFHQKDRPYPKGTTFTREQLLEITPKAVHDFMALKAFGKINYGDNDRSTGARYSNLEYIKKSLSFYMPNKGPQWCNGQGNPTKSGLVNGLLRLVQKLEAGGRGRKARGNGP